MTEKTVKKIEYSRELPRRVLEALNGESFFYWLEGDWADFDSVMSIRTNLDEVFIEMRSPIFGECPLSFIFRYFSHVMSFTTLDFHSKFTHPASPEASGVLEKDRFKIGYFSLPIYDQKVYSQNSVGAEVRTNNRLVRKALAKTVFFRALAGQTIGVASG